MGAVLGHLKMMALVGVLGLGVAGMARPASAKVVLGIGLNFGVPAPVVVAPAPVVVPAPGVVTAPVVAQPAPPVVVQAAPVVVAQPAPVVVVAPAPYYVHGYWQGGYYYNQWDNRRYVPYGPGYHH